MTKKCRFIPAQSEVHLIADNYATHKHAKVKRWFQKHPRFQLHFTPTGSSWLNLVERFFADLTQDCVRDGSFKNVRELVQAIEEYPAARNEHPKRYVWRAKGEEILKKIQRAKEAFERVINKLIRIQDTSRPQQSCVLAQRRLEWDRA